MACIEHKLLISSPKVQKELMHLPFFHIFTYPSHCYGSTIFGLIVSGQLIKKKNKKQTFSTAVTCAETGHSGCEVLKKPHENEARSQHVCLSHIISGSDVKHIDGGDVLSGSAGEEMVCEAQMTPCGNRKGGVKKKGKRGGKA